MVIVILVAIVIVLLIAAPAAANIYTDYLWFQSVGQVAVFKTVLTSEFTLFALGAGVFLLLTMASLLIARVVVSRVGELPTAREGVFTYIARMQAKAADRRVTYGALIITVVVAFFEGLFVASEWPAILTFVHQTPFGTRDPLFGMDVGFYVFSLPILHLIQGWCLVTLILIAGITGGYYVLRSYGFSFQSSDVAALAAVHNIRLHFLAMAALFALLLAWGYVLGTYDLVYAQHNVFTGAGYADVHAALPALRILAVIAIAMGAAFVVTAFRKGYALAGLSVTVWILAAILLGGVYPSIVQKVEVQPSELARESSYISNNIAMTRRAFNLSQIDVQQFPGDASPAPGVVERNPQTFSNIRLWDYRPLLATYNQIQTIRLYYQFNDIDIDRYRINGKYQQVVLSARELAPTKLPAQAQTWLNQRLQFTHGYGLAMSPVNEVTSEGLPQFIVQDIPPTGSIPITHPEIYFGESGNGYVIVDTSADEFDYPKGNQNVYAKYQGDGGVVLNSIWRKLAFALHFQDTNMLLTSYLQPNSRIIYNRQITNRADLLAPFLLKDPDPYLVVSGGQLYWYQDAYTYTDAYPYSTPQSNGLNYIRNSVKIVTNAYDGSIHLYVSDPSDPMIQTYEKIFPSLFQPMSAMTADQRAHIRYPEGMFLIQSQMLRAYHMTDPQVFYNREDLWDIPQDGSSGTAQSMQPYYVVMRLPGAKQEEFLLMLPFTPAGKTNMIAWLAAESDAPNYGKMVVFQYPKDKVIFGPMQVEARIDQDPSISAQLTLWGQQGSRVIRGNLLVLPIENSTLYVEPLYLQANQSQLPELKRVILATEDKLVMGTSLNDALQQLFGQNNNTSASSTSATGTQPTSGTTVPSATLTPIANLVKSAQTHYANAQQALKDGNWAAYGQELQALESDLNQLQQQTAKATGQ